MKGVERAYVFDQIVEIGFCVEGAFGPSYYVVSIRDEA
jgi:hypothetical protein